MTRPGLPQRGAPRSDRRRGGAAAAWLVLAAAPAGAFPTLGPSAYLCFDAATTSASGSCGSAESPLDPAATSYFHLEDFEDDAFEPGWSVAGVQTRSGPGPTTDSVDEDDGAIDGSGTAGGSHAEADDFTIEFDANALGALPTQVGLVWTDGGTSVTATLEVFGAAGNSLGSIGSLGVGDASDAGETAEDRFFGWVEPTGISAVRVSQSGGGPIEIDHLQYGGPAGPPTPTGDHFLCYEAKPTKGSPAFVPLGVSLANAFETGPADVKKVAALCNPADKNGEGIADPDSHLVSFKIKPGVEHVKQSGPVSNQFGTLLLETDKADRLLVPAARSLEGPVDPPLEPTVDHFECYPVKVPKGAEKFAALEAGVADEFAATRTLDVKKPTRVCIPVDKNGEGIPVPEAALLCYKAKPAKGEPKHEKRTGVHVAHQFGAAQLDTVKEEELCVPSVLSGPAPE